MNSSPLSKALRAGFVAAALILAPAAGVVQAQVDDGVTTVQTDDDGFDWGWLGLLGLLGLAGLAGRKRDDHTHHTGRTDRT